MKGLTDQQATAVELTLKASLREVLIAMALDFDDVAVVLEVRQPDGEFAVRTFVVAPLPPRTVEPGRGAVTEEDDALVVDVTDDRPAEEGVDFFIQPKPGLPAPGGVGPAVDVNGNPGVSVKGTMKTSPIYDI